MKEHNVKDLTNRYYLHTKCVSTAKKIGIALLLSTALPVSMLYAENKRENSTHLTQSSTIGQTNFSQDTLKASYISQQIDGTELMKVKDANFVNSLIGRLTGATINPGASGVGGSARMVLRGYRSILKSNNVLFTLDGVPLPRLEARQPYNIYWGSGQTGDGIAAFCPDDIENISVLSTVAASTLYGSRSASGVVMINTKKAHAGKLRVEVGNSTTFSSPLVMPEFQQTYDWRWGEKLSHPQSWNPADFFRTGHAINNSLALSIGNEYNQTRVSAVTMNGAGIIPNNDVDRYNFSLRNTSSLLRNRLKLDVNLRYIHTAEQNIQSQGMYDNPLVPVYLLPDVLLERIPVYPGSSDKYSYKDLFEVYVPELDGNVQYWPLGEMGLGMQNPYWTINRNMYNRKKKRLIGGIGAKFDLNSWLNVSGRIQYDRDKEFGTQKLYASTVFAGRLGTYYENENKNTQIYSEFLLNARKAMGDFSIDATLGSSVCDTKFDYSNSGGELGTLNLFELSALSKREGAYSMHLQRDYHDRTTSLFMLAQLGYKNRLFLDLGGRMEWLKFWDDDDSRSSTDVFYPSAGVSVVPTGWLSANPDRILSFLKLNYTYSETGNSFTDYIFLTKERVGLEPRLVDNNLEPERTKSHEIGLNAGFLDDKISLAFTMYKTSTSDLPFGGYVPVPYPSADSPTDLYLMDTGCRVDNKGFELSLGTNMNIGQVKWNGRWTYSINKNEIKQIREVRKNSVTGEDVVLDEVKMAEGGSWYIPLKKGGSIGDIYVTDLQRDAQGNVIVDKASQNVIPARDYIYAGNADPKYTMGLANSFSWKGLEVDFVIHARFGGVGLSMTQAVMDQFGVSQVTAIARDNGGVWVSGENIPAKDYYQKVGGARTGTVYTYDATNIRLAEMSIAYHIPVNRWVKWIQDVRVALVGRNLLMLYNKAPFDPESTASTGTWYQGIDFFRQPSCRNMGFSVNLTF